MSCLDFPACGHEMGCCPDFDAAGNQLNMVCLCGATLPMSSRSSICKACLHADDEDEEDYDAADEDEYLALEHDYDGFVGYYEY